MQKWYHNTPNYSIILDGLPPIVCTTYDAVGELGHGFANAKK